MTKLHKLICGEADAELVACTCLSQFFLFFAGLLERLQTEESV